MLVYRGSSHDNLLISNMSEGEGVYVSEDRTSAAQWGEVRTYRLRSKPRLLDLLSPAARGLIAEAMGEVEDQDVDAGDVFIQCRGTNLLRLEGYDGYKLGYDVFLLGNLLDHAEEVKP